MPDRLERYRAKRDPGRTPEPFGPVRDAPAGEAHLFVVQQHAARRLHWDFRLELAGTLRSWAVPKGPSADPAEKRMAVEVEDHPVEYAGFEGIIPGGNYGAGAVILWDRGVWRAVDGDPEEGLRRGKLVFTLDGYKLRGEWTLVRTKGKGGEKPQWLLMKHRGDAWAGPGRPFPAQSVLSGLTVEELAAGASRAGEVLAEARRLGARPLAGQPGGGRATRPGDGAMLAQAAEAPFDDPGWLFELKYDGYRLAAERSGARVSLTYRGGQDATALYPELAPVIAALPCDARLDGEVVVLEPDGRPSFQKLQGRAQLARPDEVARAAVERPATLFAFDLLEVGGLDTRPLALADRKRLLQSLLPKLGAVRYADHLVGRGVALLEKVRELGLEGIVAKRADSPYRPGRSAAWLKIRIERSGDFAVVGFTAPRGGRIRFGALHLAVFDGCGLVYAGSVGTGFDDTLLGALHARLAPRARPTPPCTGPLPRGRGHTWVEPELVCQVRFGEWTDEGLLRHPVFERLREDKRPEETVREGGEPAAPPATGAKPAPSVAVTHPDKVFFPGEGITKGDLVAYHRAIAPFMLPYLKDRPLVLTRYPDGILGKSFFQKDAPEWAPAWLRTVRIHGQEGGRDLDHFLVDDAEGLAWIANTGTIPIHVWSSRAPPRGGPPTISAGRGGGGQPTETPSLERPDWCIVDLDPKGAPFAHVVKLAQAVHALCDELGLPSHCKTTGQDGLHVLVPLGGRLTHGQSRTLAELLARAVEAEHPEVATTARAIGARGGKVYLDYLQNGLGKTIAAPYTVRPRAGAPVSTPLRWSEVNGKLDPARFTLRNAVARAERLGEDPLLAVLDEKPDLLAALARLKDRLEAGPAPKGRRPAPSRGSR